MKIYIEAQWDPGASEIRMSATTGFGQQSYRVTKRDVDREAAEVAFRQFVELYRSCGADVVLPSGSELEATA